MDYDVAVDFGDYSTYDWEPRVANVGAPVPPADDLQLRRVQAALEETLGARGLQKVIAGGDLWVRYGVEYGERYDYFPQTGRCIGCGGYFGPFEAGYGYGGYGYGYGRCGCGFAPAWGGLHSGYPVGRTVWRIGVDFIERATKRIVWHGRAEQTISPGVTPETRIRKIRGAIASLLERYPPIR